MVPAIFFGISISFAVECAGLRYCLQFESNEISSAAIHGADNYLMEKTVTNFFYPYLLDYSRPDVEQIAILVVAFLTAILISAEGQGFVATFLGGSREHLKDRLHFNVFMHLSVPGTINFFVAGFGWARELKVDTGSFRNYPKLYPVVSHLAGPLANFLLANIAASLAWILARYGFEDKVFTTIVVVNITMAVYGLIPVPPLPGFAVLNSFLPSGQAGDQLREVMKQYGPYLIIASFFVFRITVWGGADSLFTPVVKYLVSLILVL